MLKQRGELTPGRWGKWKQPPPRLTEHVRRPRAGRVLLLAGALSARGVAGGEEDADAGVWPPTARSW